MITLGIMTLNIESERLYINEMAKQAESCGIEIFRFVPTEINPHTQLVKGKKYRARLQAWEDDEFPIPAILYDRCFYGDDEHSKLCLPIVSWLKSRSDLTFLGYGLPNKLELYHALKQTKLAPYLPPTKPVSEIGMVLKELDEGNKLILKPINGSQGIGIYYLKKKDKTFHVKTEKQKKIISRIFPNRAKLIQWLQQLLSTRQYLSQPFLELFNDKLEPFDIRVLLQKDEQGKWNERGRGIRIGNTGGILSNLSAGGSAVPFSNWAASVPSANTEYIHQELEFILSELPQLLENRFLPLFEIGLDIGIGRNGAVWILDSNSKPGRKVLLQTKPELKEALYLAPLLYAKHLFVTGPKERKNVYAQTLSH